MNCPRTGHRKKSRNCAQTAGSMTWPALDPYVPLADHLANQRNGRSQWMKCLKQKRTRMDEKVDGVVQIATLSTQSPPVDEFSFRWRMNRNVLFSVKWKWFVKKFPASPNFPIPFKFRILIADWLIYRSWKFQPCKQNMFCEINFKVKRVSLFFKKIFLPYLISGLTWNLCSTKLVISTIYFKNLNFVVNLVFVVRIFKCDPI